MATLLLIHGSWHGAWCWERLLPALAAAGHEARAIDLPGHGEDETPLPEIDLAAYTRCIQQAAEAMAPVVAVGHSMGGLAITAAAAERPELFAALVYVCAFVPVEGENLTVLAQAAPDSELIGAAEIGAESISLRPELTTSAFYGECSEADARTARDRLRTEPLIPAIQPVPGGLPEALPRAYVECLRDRSIPVAHQRFMRDRGGVEALASLDTDHSPFLSMPGDLAAALGAYARRYD
ncbi:MAG: alpha/beta fold hydrolase [Myxococcota bacterium]|nr:alpha/beta fold hydrolase [Myxococcota bacterium]